MVGKDGYRVMLMVDVERLFFVPQYPVRMRYQEWWFWYLPEKFSKYFDDVVIISPETFEIEKADDKIFSVIDKALEFEAMQIKEYLKADITDNDYVFFADISFAGIVPQIIYHKRKGKKFGFAHATSLNRYDYFASVRKGKWYQEKGIILSLDKIFVASKYHKLKIFKEGFRLNGVYDRIEVVGLPKPPFKTYREKKEYDVLFAGRMTKQKFSEHIWKTVLGLGLDARIKHFESWEEYYKGLSKAKVVLQMSKEETYGYQVVEAILNNSVVLAPTCCSFLELLPRKYLYSNSREFVDKILYYVEHYDEVPELNKDHVKLMNNWFKNVYKIMTRE